MPRAIKTLEQESATISKNIVKQIALNFLKTTSFKEEVKYFLTDELEGGTKEVHNLFTKDDSKNIVTPYHNFAFITFTERYVEDAVNISRWQNKYITDVFSDPEHGITISPKYAVAIVEMTIKLRCRDLTKLKGYLNGFRLRHSLTNASINHTASYDYELPHEFIAFLLDAHGLKEGDFPDGEDLGTYLKRCFKTGIQKRSNINGESNEIIMVENQSNIIGQVTEEFFYNEKEANDGLFEVNIPYKFEYRKPLALSMVTPAYIRNSRIPLKYVKKWIPAKRSTIDAEDPLWNRSGFSLDKANQFYIGDGGSRVCEWDDWFPKVYYKETQTVSIIPAQVNPSDLKEIFDLNTIPEEYVPANVINYLSKYHVHQGLYKESLVVLELFEVGLEEKRIIIVFDENLILRSYEDLDPKKRYYLRISLLRDLARYNAKETKALLEAPEDIIELFKLYDPTVYLSSDKEHAEESLPVVLTNGRYTEYPSVLFTPAGGAITAHSFTCWLRKLKDTNLLFLRLNPYTGKSVGRFNIIARKG